MLFRSNQVLKNYKKAYLKQDVCAIIPLNNSDGSLTPNGMTISPDDFIQIFPWRDAQATNAGACPGIFKVYGITDGKYVNRRSNSKDKIPPSPETSSWGFGLTDPPADKDIKVLDENYNELPNNIDLLFDNWDGLDSNNIPIVYTDVHAILDSTSYTGTDQEIADQKNAAVEARLHASGIVTISDWMKING